MRGDGVELEARAQLQVRGVIQRVASETMSYSSSGSFPENFARKPKGAVIYTGELIL